MIDVNWWSRGVASAMLLLVFGVGVVAAQEPPAEERPEILDIDDGTEYPEVPAPAEDLPPARMEICFDLVSRARTLGVEANEPFTIYVLAHNSRWGVRGWEAKLKFDARIKILDAEFEGINAGQGADWFVGIVPAKCFLGSTAILARFEAVVVDPDATDLVLALAPTDRSSFDPPSPGYLVCKPTNELFPYVACDTCAVVNPLKVQPDADEDPVAPGLFEPVRGKLR